MKRKIKKGFTIVELVIVIAIIAVLAAVLIPTFANLIDKANRSADIQAARQLNIALANASVIEKPDRIEKVREILIEAGYNDSLEPITQGFRFYWYENENLILLVEIPDFFENKPLELNTIQMTDAYRATVYYPVDSDIEGTVAYNFQSNLNKLIEEHLLSYSGLSADANGNLSFATTKDEIITYLNGCPLGEDIKSVFTTIFYNDLCEKRGNQSPSQDQGQEPEVPVEVTSVSLDRDTLELQEGDTFTLTATVEPEDATNTDILWNSINPGVASVNENGVVTAVAAGTTTITATCGDKSDECKVTVIGNSSGEESNENEVKLEIIGAEKLTMNAPTEYTVNILEGDLPANAEIKITTSWDENENYIEVGPVEGNKFNVTAFAVGDVELRAQVFIDDEPQSQMCTLNINITPAFTGTPEFGKNTYNGSTGGTASISVVNKKNIKSFFVWTIDNPEIITFDDGNATKTTDRTTISVQFKKAGRAFITFKEGYNGTSITCEVVVTTKVESITIKHNGTTLNSDSVLVIKSGSTETITVDVGDASNKAINWSDNDFVTIEPSGDSYSTYTIKPNKIGEVTIVANAADGSGVSTSFKVQVVHSVEIVGDHNENNPLIVIPGIPVRLSAILTPTDVKAEEIEWTVDNTERLSLDYMDDNSGVTISAKETPGKATIEKATISVKVKGTNVVLATCEVVVPDKIDYKTAQNTIESSYKIILPSETSEIIIFDPDDPELRQKGEWKTSAGLNLVSNNWTSNNRPYIKIYFAKPGTGVVTYTVKENDKIVYIAAAEVTRLSEANEIKSAEDFKNAISAINNNTSENTFEVTLANDIDLSAIGDYTLPILKGAKGKINLNGKTLTLPVGFYGIDIFGELTIEGGNIVTNSTGQLNVAPGEPGGSFTLRNVILTQKSGNASCITNKGVMVIDGCDIINECNTKNNSVISVGTIKDGIQYPGTMTIKNTTITGTFKDYQWPIINVWCGSLTLDEGVEVTAERYSGSSSEYPEIWADEDGNISGSATINGVKVDY